VQRICDASWISIIKLSPAKLPNTIFGALLKIDMEGVLGPVVVMAGEAELGSHGQLNTCWMAAIGTNAIRPAQDATVSDESVRSVALQIAPDWAHGKCQL